MAQGPPPGMPPEPPGMPPPPAGIPPTPPPHIPDPPGGSFDPNVQATAARSSEDAAMLVLSYLSILGLIPYFTSKSPEVRWHAKQGLLLALVFFSLRIATWLPVIGWVVAMLLPLLGLVYFVLVVVCIVKALSGERWRIPIIADYAEKWSV